MSAPAFTPGPWAYEPTSGAIYYADGDVEPLIASTNLDSVSEEQGDADGHLIAAAPELYEALELAVKKLRAAAIAGGTDAEFTDIMLQPFNAALAKARGETA